MKRSFIVWPLSKQLIAMETRFFLSIGQFATIAVFLAQAKDTLGSQRLCDKLLEAQHLVKNVKHSLSALRACDHLNQRFSSVPSYTEEALRIYLMMLEYVQLILMRVMDPRSDSARLKSLLAFFASIPDNTPFPVPYIDDVEGVPIHVSSYGVSRDFSDEERNDIETLNLLIRYDPVMC
jgi:hypothetical protein